MKKCFKCGETKPLSEFYPHAQMADGYLNKCAICTKKDAAKHRYKLLQNPVWVEKERARCREKQKNNPERARKATDQWRQKTGWKPDPEKRRVRAIVGNAIRDGRLIRLPCQICGASKTHAHHPDYSKPFEVVWLCPTHHGEQHWKAA